MNNASRARESSPSADRPASHTVSGPALWRVLYGTYAWLQFLLIGLVTLVLLLCLPTLRARRALTRGSARLALALGGMRVRTHALGTLPMPCIVVANHASYLDGVLLNALLPTDFSFVIKREMSSVPLAGLLLRRLGAEFVERRGRAQGLGDARRLLRQASSGEALVFFPEGTFSPVVGLLHFHTGAFTAAVRANLPIVPIAIRGTRRCLSPGSSWPCPGRIEVEALPAILPHSPTSAPAPSTPEMPTATVPESGHSSERRRATELRDRARAALLSALGEPDLAVC